MKQIIILALFLNTAMHAGAQVLPPEENTNPDNLYLSPAKQTGYWLTGLGAATIGETALKIIPVKSQAPWFIGGAAALAAGLYFLFIADDDYKQPYWKGMQGNVLRETKRNEFFFTASIPVLQSTIFQNKIHPVVTGYFETAGK